MKKKWFIDIIVGLAIFIAYIAYFFGSGQSYFANFIVYICLFIIAGEGWNVLGGYIGEVSFGHAVFFGIGAYTVALANGYHIPIPIPILVVLGALISGLFAWLISYPLLRVKGFSFLIGTFGLGVIFLNVFKSNEKLFANKGIYVSYVPSEIIYPIIVATTIVIVILLQYLIKSNLGLSFKAVRDVPEAAEMIGINLYHTKTQALVIGAIITGLAGAFYALYQMHITPNATFDTSISNAILLGPYIGGCGSVIGTMIGSAMMIIIQEVARTTITITGGHNLVLGIILIVVMMTMKQGIWNAIVEAAKKLYSGMKSRREVKAGGA